MRSKLDIELPQSDLDLEEKPFLLCGFGINAFMDLTGGLGFLMLFLRILNIPLFYIYSQNGALSQDLLSTLTIGNLGGSDSICSHIPSNSEKSRMALRCNSGRINLNAHGSHLSQITQMGIIPSGNLEVNACNQKAFTDPYNCTSYLNQERILEALQSAHG